MPSTRSTRCSVRSTVQKQITGQTAGFAGGITFPVTLNCGPGLIYQLSVPAGDSVTQDDIPVGATCVATEAAPVGGLLDASFAWGDTTYDPVDGAVTVQENVAQDIVITQHIVRVLAPVRVVKSYSGPQGVIDPAKTYPITWSCDYGGGQETFGGTVNVVVDAARRAGRRQRAADRSLHRDRGRPRAAIAGPGVPLAGPGHHRHHRDRSPDRTPSPWRTRWSATPAPCTSTRSSRAPPRATSTWVPEPRTSRCTVSAPSRDSPQIPTRYADGSIADGGTRTSPPRSAGPAPASRTRPGQDLLKDASYAWAPPVHHRHPAAGTGRHVRAPAPTRCRSSTPRTRSSG